LGFLLKHETGWLGLAGVVVVNGGALDLVVGLADLRLISVYRVIFCRSLFLLSSGVVVVVNGVRYIITSG
jgi:hypothetical protein